MTSPQGHLAGMAPLETRLRAQAFGLGFDLAGIATLGPADSRGQFDAWLRNGYAGSMTYLCGERAELRRDSSQPAPGMRSALVVGLNYGGTQPGGPIARYARGDDYHGVMRAKLQDLGEWLAAAARDAKAGVAQSRAYVDTGPVLERDLARRAGPGWFGKNTNLINPRLGSFFFIGALFTNLELRPDAPFAADRCGSCTRCLDACPTKAFVAPCILDATRCISYLTIELKGAIPTELRPAMGELLYGCDICQDVCPWNIRFSRAVTEPALAPKQYHVTPDAVQLLRLDQVEWSARFASTALSRAKRRGLARNAAVALGNRRDPRTIPALVAARRDDPEPLVREHADWALGQFR